MSRVTNAFPRRTSDHQLHAMCPSNAAGTGKGCLEPGTFRAVDMC